MLIYQEARLRNKVIKALKFQGFEVNNGNLSLVSQDRESKRQAHNKAKYERISENIKFISQYRGLVDKYFIDGNDLKIDKINPRIIEITNDDIYAKIFRWWNLVWWSLPYEKAYGRQIRLLIWDSYHNAPIGLVGLQSPILSWKVRDDYLDISRETKDYWINQSLSAQRLGALPPYNSILGGKLVAMLMTTNKVRQIFKDKYINRETVLEKRNIPANLLFITTTGAFGKSSVYNRLKFHDEEVAKFIGYSHGSGSFHIPDTLYEELVKFLESKSKRKVERSYGNGPSRKMRIIRQSLSQLGFKNGQNHGIRRAVYIFPLAKNLHEVIHKSVRPKYFDRSIKEMCQYWRDRWVNPRVERLDVYKDFQAKKFIEEEFGKYHSIVKMYESK